MKEEYICVSMCVYVCACVCMCVLACVRACMCVCCACLTYFLVDSIVYNSTAVLKFANNFHS